MDSCGLFLRFEIWQSVFLALPQGKERNAECKKKDHYQIWQGRNPDGGYGGGVPEVLPAMVAAEKEGTEEPGGYGGAGIQDGVL